MAMSSVGLDEFSNSGSDSGEKRRPPDEEAEQERESLFELYADAKNRWKVDGLKCFYLHTVSKKFYIWDQLEGSLMEFANGDCEVIWSSATPGDNAEIWTVLPLPPTDAKSHGGNANPNNVQQTPSPDDDNKVQARKREREVEDALKKEQEDIRAKYMAPDEYKRYEKKRRKEKAVEDERREQEDAAMIGPQGRPDSNGVSNGESNPYSTLGTDEKTTQKNAPASFRVLGLPCPNAELVKDNFDAMKLLESASEQYKLNVQAMHELKRLPVASVRHLLRTFEAPQHMVVSDSKAVSQAMLEHLADSRKQIPWLFGDKEGVIGSFPAGVSGILGSLFVPQLEGMIPPTAVRIDMTENSINVLDLETADFKIEKVDKNPAEQNQIRSFANRASLVLAFYGNKRSKDSDDESDDDEPRPVVFRARIERDQGSFLDELLGQQNNSLPMLKHTSKQTADPTVKSVSLWDTINRITTDHAPITLLAARRRALAEIQQKGILRVTNDSPDFQRYFTDLKLKLASHKYKIAKRLSREKKIIERGEGEVISDDDDESHITDISVEDEEHLQNLIDQRAGNLVFS